MAVRPPKKKPNWSHVISIEINCFGRERRTDIKTPSGLLVGQHDRYSIGLRVCSVYQPVVFPESRTRTHKHDLNERGERGEQGRRRRCLAPEPRR